MSVARRAWAGRRRGLRRVLLIVLAVAVTGCAQGRTVVPVRMQPAASLPSPIIPDLSSYEATVRTVAGVITRDVGLPLPETVTVYVYSSRQVFEEGLVADGQVSRVRAAELSDFAIGVGKRRQLLLHHERNVASTEWVRLVAHELAHVSQIEMAEAEGRAEQWLAEGMAEWVSFRVLERLGLDTVARRRRIAIATIRDHAPILARRLDLDALGTSRGFTVRHLREGSQATYQMSYLLADYLIAREGFGSLVGYFRSFAVRSDRRANFQAAFGQPLREFEQEAVVHLAKFTQ
jgi:hypothetical protein